MIRIAVEDDAGRYQGLVDFENYAQYKLYMAKMLHKMERIVIRNDVPEHPGNWALSADKLPQDGWHFRVIYSSRAYGDRLRNNPMSEWHLQITGEGDCRLMIAQLLDESPWLDRDVMRILPQWENI